MDFCSFLSHDSIRLTDHLHSKKKVLEELADMLTAAGGPSTQAIFDSLLEREKIGSTALGKGVAIPHCRITGSSRPLVCLLRTETGVDYDAPDGMPVSLFFALLVPENADDEHLQLLGDLAHKLDDPACIKRLMQASGAAQIIAALEKQSPPHAA